MKNKFNAVLSLGVCAFAVLFISLCSTAFADDAAQPTVQVGVVAQRYPWNGTLDVGYRASGLPTEGTNAVLTVTVSGDRVYTQNVTLANGTNTLAFTSLPKDLKAKDAKVTLAIEKK